jgi:hypothetical protein
MDFFNEKTVKTYKYNRLLALLCFGTSRGKTRGRVTCQDVLFMIKVID